MVKIPMEDEGHTQIAVTVPLFLKKLWKMVNDKEAEGIIGWNSAGDGFIIYDQLQFITKLLPQYFKHNHMASFIRQLNFYDFHKIAGIDKDEIQFAHNYFVKDLPETLVFIKRKCTSVKSKLANSVKEEELSDLLSGVKELKTKHSLVDNELKMLKQENAALWSEINNLRIKHSKQTKVINKIIHFLISYMHSQNSLSKRNVVTTRKGNQKNLKSGPTILEIDYHNHHTDTPKPQKQNSYIVQEPSSDIDYSLLDQSVSKRQLTSDNSVEDIFLNSTLEQDPNPSYSSPYTKKCILVSNTNKTASSNKTLRNNDAKKQKVKSEVLNPNIIDSLQANTPVNISSKSRIPQSLFITKIEDKNYCGTDSENDTDNSKAVALGLSKISPRFTVDNTMNNPKTELMQNYAAPVTMNSKNNSTSTRVLENPEDQLDSYLPANERTSSLKGPVKYNILENPKENLGLYLNNIQMELNSLQDVLGNLSSTELNNFCQLMESMQPEMDEDSLGMGTSEEDMKQINELEAEQIPIENSEELVSKDTLIDELNTLPMECDLGDNINNENSLPMECNLSDNMNNENNLPVESNLSDNMNNENNNFDGDQFTQDTISEVLVDKYFNTEF